MKVFGNLIRFMSRASLALVFVIGGIARTAEAEVSPASDAGDAYTRWIVLNWNQYSAVDEYEFTSPQPGTWQPPVLEKGTDVVGFAVTRNDSYCARLAVSFKAFGWGCYKIYNEHVAYRLWVQVDNTQTQLEAGGAEVDKAYSVNVGETISFRNRYILVPCNWALLESGKDTPVAVIDNDYVKVEILPPANGDYMAATILVTGKKPTGENPVKFSDYYDAGGGGKGVFDSFAITVPGQPEPPPGPTYIPVTVTAVDAWKSAGDDDPTFDVTIEGVEEGDEGLLEFEVWRTPLDETVGTYALHVGGAKVQLDKYEVTYMDGTFEIRRDGYYDTFRAAYEGVENATFTLEKDLICDDDALVQGPSAFTIDLNGYRIIMPGSSDKAMFTVDSGKTLTVVDSSSGATGTVEAECSCAVRLCEGSVFDMSGGTLQGNGGIEVLGTATVGIRDSRLGTFGGTFAPLRLLGGESVVAISNTVLKSAHPLIVSETGDATAVTLEACTLNGRGAETYMFRLGGEGTSVSVVGGTVRDDSYAQATGCISALADNPAQLTVHEGVAFTLRSEDVVSAESLAADVALDRTGDNTWISVNVADYVAVTIRANDAEKIENDPDPPLGVTIEGEIGEEDKAKLVCKVERESGASVGTYRIRVTGEKLQMDKYRITFIGGTFEIKADTRPGYDAFKAAYTGAAGGTFRLEKDIVCPWEEDGLRLGSSAFTIDLNGHSLLMSGVNRGSYLVIPEGRTLTVTDSSGSASGKVEYQGTSSYVKMFEIHGTLNVGLNEGETLNARNTEGNRVVWIAAEGAAFNMTGGALDGYWCIHAPLSAAIFVGDSRIGAFSGTTVPIWLQAGASTVTLSNAVLRSAAPPIQAGDADKTDASTVILADCEIVSGDAGGVFRFDNGSTTAVSLRGGAVDDAVATALANRPAQVTVHEGVDFTVATADAIATLAPGITIRDNGDGTWTTVKAEDDSEAEALAALLKAMPGAAAKINAVVGDGADRIGAKALAAWLCAHGSVDATELSASAYVVASVQLGASGLITDGTAVAFTSIETASEGELVLAFGLTPETVTMTKEFASRCIWTTEALEDGFSEAIGLGRVTAVDGMKVTVERAEDRAKEFYKIVLPEDPRVPQTVK